MDPLQCSSKMNIKKKIQENIVFKTLKQRSLINRVNTQQIYGLIRSVWKSSTFRLIKIVTLTLTNIKTS